MKAIVFSVFASVGAVLVAGGQSGYVRTQDLEWKIAQRFDDGRVVVMLSMDDNYLQETKRNQIAGALWPGKAMAEFLMGARSANADWVRESTGSNARLGDKWAIDAGRGGWFTGSVNDFVLANAACSEAGAMSVELDPSRRAAFSRIKEKYFPAHQIASWQPAARSTQVGPATYAVSAAERQQIQKLLRAEVKRTSPAVLSDRGEGGRNPQYGHFQKVYDRLINGEGDIRFDTQAFRVTPDGVARLFVRSVFQLDGKQVYFLSAWIKTGPALEVEQSEAAASFRAWVPEFNYDVYDPAVNGQILTVSDIDRDGTAELIIKYDGYEDFVLELTRYPPAPRSKNNILAVWGMGC